MSHPPPHRRHHHHHHHSQCHSPPSSSCCCCYCSCCCSSPSPPPPPLPTTSAHLLQGLAAHLLQSPNPPPSPPPTLFSYQFVNSQPDHHLPHETHEAKDPPIRRHHHHDLLRSLLHRVAALESSFRHHPSPHSPTPHPPKGSPPAASVRDMSARTIQAQFRLFLVRRSRALRHLRRLAAMRSDLDPKGVSTRISDLLLDLDSIKSGDPMVQQGKRSIGRELARIVEYVEVMVKEQQELSAGDHTKVVSGQAVDEMDRIAMKPKKKVSFLENDKEAEDGEDGNGFESIAEGASRKDGELGLSAPLPVHMEPGRYSGGGRR